MPERDQMSLAPSKGTTEIEHKRNGQIVAYIHFRYDESGLEGYYTCDAFTQDWVWVSALQLLPNQHERMKKIVAQWLEAKEQARKEYEPEEELEIA